MFNLHKLLAFKNIRFFSRGIFFFIYGSVNTHKKILIILKEKLITDVTLFKDQSNMC